ncbi:MAG TPA: DUF2892 domain-containing protein [Melioribacteraceae bacterium]|nr:DUF2892 domain-containing protein [Melioribacteraceae bacterium]
MEKNVGGIDKIVRIILGVIIILLGIIFNSWWGAIGIIPLLTGLFGRCGLYCPLGINTCNIKEHNTQNK